MRYDLHITKGESWVVNEGQEIAPAEWLAYVNLDPELELRPENGPHSAVWQSDPGSKEEQLSQREGNIDATNPSEALVVKMCEIAQLLSARVQGDNGEFYPEALAKYPKAMAKLAEAEWYVILFGALLIVDSVVLTSVLVWHLIVRDSPVNHATLWSFTKYALWPCWSIAFLITWNCSVHYVARVTYEKETAAWLGMLAVFVGAIPLFLAIAMEMFLS